MTSTSEPAPPAQASAATAPLLLSVDTATARGVVVLSRGASVLASSTYLAGSDHAEKLLGHVGDVLASARVLLAEIAGFGVGVGPGSFTGVRVGVTTIKAFVLAFPRPILPVSTLHQIVRAAGCTSAGEDSTAIAGLLSAGREDCFAQVFEAAGPIGEPEVVAHASLPAWLSARGILHVVGQEAMRWCGDVAVDRTRAEGLPTPEILAELAFAVWGTRNALCGVEAASLEPSYARPPQITSARVKAIIT